MERKHTFTRLALLASLSTVLLAVVNDSPAMDREFGIEAPAQPVLRRQPFPEKLPPAPGPDPALSGQRAFDYLLTLDGKALADEQRFDATVKSVGPRRLILEPGDDHRGLLLEYQLLGGQHELALEPGNRVLLRAREALVLGSLVRNLVVSREGQVVVAFLKEGGTEPLLLDTQAGVVVEQVPEERNVRGEHNGLREYSLPVRVSWGRQSKIVAVGEQTTLGEGSQTIKVLIRASSQQEAYGKDAAKARARMEGPPYHLDIVIYR